MSSIDLRPSLACLAAMGTWALRQAAPENSLARLALLYERSCLAQIVAGSYGPICPICDEEARDTLAGLLEAELL